MLHVSVHFSSKDTLNIQILLKTNTLLVSVWYTTNVLSAKDGFIITQL